MRISAIVLLLLVLLAGDSATAETLTYQPGPEDGIDMWYSNYYTYSGSHFVNDSKLQVGGWGDQYWLLIKFDLGCLPKSINSVKLYLMPYSRGDSSTPVSMNGYILTKTWTESGGWSGSMTGNQNGNLSAPTPGNWYVIDITAVYDAWNNGVFTNYGVAFLPTANDNRFNVFRSSDYSNTNQRPKLVIDYTPNSSEPFKPCFPLKDHTPYSAKITSVLDHSIPGGFYTRDKVVRAYNGETGSVNPYPFTSTIVGYERNDGEAFDLPLLAYTDDGASASDKNILFYDGHSGYDYKASWEEAILSTTDGTLCVATSRTSQNGQLPWRNSSKCPYGNDTAIVGGLDATRPTSWERWHMFYIVHSGGTYSTWYLHVNRLDTNILSSILQNGYASVARLQVVAYVGNWGLVPLGSTSQSNKHLHVEMRTGMDSVNVRDPYGSGTPGSILWGPKP